MLDLNQVRADFADFLADHAGTRHSLDAALMHVVERAYQQGLADGQESKGTPFARMYGCLGPAEGFGDIEDASL